MLEILCGLIIGLILGAFSIWLRYRNIAHHDNFHKENHALLHELNTKQQLSFDKLLEFKDIQQQAFHGQQQELATQLINHLKVLQESTQGHFSSITQQLLLTLKQNAEQINVQLQELTQRTERHLLGVSERVDKTLQEGFAKTNETFNNITQRLVIIDQAQQKLTELSNNVVSLQEILADKRARGSFGEMQLAALINNLLPPQCVSYQHLLSNGKRVDCMLMLPEPSGNIPIDAKFPLESYKLAHLETSTDVERKFHVQQFKQDVRKHILDIANKYILPGETADGAVLFIPAEAVFAYIHGYLPEIVEFAQQQRVWLVSPTTLMAILNTARSVLKDYASRQQVNLIRIHLTGLAQDFSRFQKRMDNLERHINQAQEDVRDVNTSARKISERFGKIESMEFVAPMSLEDT